MNYKKMTQKKFEKIIKAHDWNKYQEIELEVIEGRDLSKIDTKLAKKIEIYNLYFKNCIVNRDFLCIADGIEDCKLSCEVPLEGEFIAWKAVLNKDSMGWCYAKLLIPKSAKRTGCLRDIKCRASKAKVVGFYAEDEKKLDIEKAYSWYNPGVAYHKGKPVVPDYYNDNILEECTYGIHFFMDIKDAIAFAKM